MNCFTHLLQNIEIRILLLRRLKSYQKLKSAYGNYRLYQKELSKRIVAGESGGNLRIFSNIFAKMFQKYAKINYRDYVQNVRLERASKELMETDHMISDIALNHGFANSKAFANAFRKSMEDCQVILEKRKTKRSVCRDSCFRMKSERSVSHTLFLCCKS